VLGEKGGEMALYQRMMCFYSGEARWLGGGRDLRVGDGDRR
jgi:hypothetical protein